MNKLSHLDPSGKASMVNVGEKPITQRTAIAEAVVLLPKTLIEQFEQGDIQVAKGSVFQTAIIAGVMAAKKTGELIPLCHPLGLDNCQITIQINDSQEVRILSEASVAARTGVEMEAMVGASIAALTIYDMCKSYSHDIEIRRTRLIKKTGGKNDFEST
jgi:cyclic pyranopterin phosphate synthase